ncbi:4'-phosphopantetheinyl transferase [Streptomyces sp. NPDC015125]|uniref:4'-phosphopantetheinyl transferase family protein n=1 Tax=Streptomyces sp. NPDC015125 TaxID=3364938 RepID=UPI0036F830AB
MIARILPGCVAAAESYGDEPAAALFPEESRLTATMSDVRRREFATVRHCARRAALRLGVPPAPLLPGPRGAPQWPHGVVGSMTHCRGYRAAALARGDHVRGVGIDAEPHQALPEGMLDRIALPGEQEQQRELRRLNGSVCWDRLLFCAKEAVYKVWSPLTRAWLGFHEASISIVPDGGTGAGTFRVRVLRAVPEGADGEVPTVLRGRWLANRQLLLAAIVVPRNPATP